MKKLKVLILLMCIFVPFAISGCENKNKSTLSTPTIVEIKGGTIVFDPVADAEYYTISINDYTVTLNATYSSKVEIIDNKINFDASNIFVVGDSYSVKIKANASNKNSSDYSATYSYKHNGNIEKPANLKINGTTLTWEAVENASYYLVKIITPNDSILFDKEGNILDVNDPESIAKADLTEYSFNTNQFDFSSLLAVAGNYKFYVCSVLSVGTNYVESGYSTTTNYTHYITLETPTNGVIKKSGDEIHLLTAVDINANAISIECNGFEKTAEINGSEQSITKINQNLLDINLNQYFESVCATTQLNFNNIAQFSFRTQSKYISITPNSAFYINSNYSDFEYFDNTLTLSAPILSVEKDIVNDCYVASWICADQNLVSEYELIVCTAVEVKKYTLDANIDNKLIYDEFVAVSIKAKGVGNYISSPLSEFVSNPEYTNQTQALSCNANNLVLSWNNISNAYYIVELADAYEIVQTNSYVVNPNILTENSFSVKVTAIKPEHKHSSTTSNLTFNRVLATPTIGYGQGFSGSNLYELTFTGVPNAFGYYVYLKTKDSSTFEKIDTLYTTTRIDLSKYICSEGDYTDYEVKVQAVADIHSIYSDSAWSSSVSVSHVKVLNKPDFYKINDSILPVTKLVEGNTTKYMLKFYGVESAGSYEILINYNKITVKATNNNLYEVDISNYLIAANNYEIKIRAIPADTAVNIQPSEYNVANYALTKQLAMVENIQVCENEGVYTLSFDPIDNADAYRVRIVKESDSNYVAYLNGLALTNSFEVYQSADVTEYVKQQGVYYFYVTALAPKQNSYYADASESVNFGYVSKLTTLEAPQNISYANLSSTEFSLSWLGDDNADYYLVKLVDPRNIAYEFKVYNSTETNINEYISVQGTYNISISSMVDSSSENAKSFTSSSASERILPYTYNERRDFLRHSVYMYGSNYNFIVTDVTDLKNLLWYHYLFETDMSTGLSVMIEPQLKEDGSTETLRESILRFAEESSNMQIYRFMKRDDLGEIDFDFVEENPGFVNSPSGYTGTIDYDKVSWNDLIDESATTSDTILFSYLCQKLLVAYPEFNVLKDFRVSHSTDSEIFNLYYHNALNEEKVADTSNTFSNKNYGNEYKYVDLYSRKSATGSFNIDSREGMYVTTTEQLLQAVQHNRKPIFVGDSAVAESVYNNAKLVLSAIVTNNMSDLEKVTAIFDWLESSYDLTYYSVDEKAYISGAIEQNELETYGLNKIYYLEGIFENISMSANGDIVVGSNLATSKSYSKAFALLCAIEGIEAIVVNGSYEYYDMTTSSVKNVDHAWNKVYISTKQDQTSKNWYAVDLTFSDNRIVFTNLRQGYGISSHTYFLTTDNFLSNYTEYGVKELSYTSSNLCNTTYNFYDDSRFAMTYKQIASTIYDFQIYSYNWICSNCGHEHIGSIAPDYCPICLESDVFELAPDATPVLATSGFNYSKQFHQDEEYQQYYYTTGYNPLQSFLLNSMIYAKHNADINESNRSVFEFQFHISDNGGSNIFDAFGLKEIFDTAPINYSLNLNLINDANGSVYTVEDKDNGTTTIVYIVEKSA